MTMPPVYGGRHGLAFVILGLSEGHFFLPCFSFSFITPSGKEEIQTKEEQQQRFMHSKDLLSEDFLLTRLCDSRLENSKCRILHRSVNQQMPCIPPHERMKRKLPLWFLSLALLWKKRGLAEMFEGKPSNKFENLTFGLHICWFHLLQFNIEVT